MSTFNNLWVTALGIVSAFCFISMVVLVGWLLSKRIVKSSKNGMQDDKDHWASTQKRVRIVAIGVGILMFVGIESCIAALALRAFADLETLFQYRKLFIGGLVFGVVSSALISFYVLLYGKMEKVLNNS